MTSLVIVESPAKCSKIAGFLGPGWSVVASFGHIRSLEEDLDAVGLDRDFELKFRFLDEKAKAISQLKHAAKSADTVYLASDDDREGEAIAYSVALLLGLNPATTPRAVFHEITAKAVKKAVAEPRRLDMNRVNAQQARAVLDMMVGFTISPLLWKYIGPALSAGRCQTPALRILCEREKDIQNFQGQTVWKIGGVWSPSTTDFHFPAYLKDELEDKESALNFLENIHSDAGAHVLTAITKPWSENPPKPLITSTLQQEASALYSSNPKKTMMIAQKLYEAGHITYMRTDHAILSEEAKIAATEVVKRILGESYLAKNETTTKKKEKEPAVAAQEAHEAIRPTHFQTMELPGDENWDDASKKIYRLIWQRAMQSVMAAAKGDDRVLQFVADGDPGEFPWEARWRRTTFAGWKKIGSGAVQLDETETTTEAEAAAASWIQAISIREGDTLKWHSLEALPHVSKPPPRYNEATLVRELEKKGIGRPSTYASLVETLFDKKYAEKKSKPAQPFTFSQYAIMKPGQWPPQEQKTTKQMGAEKDKMLPTPLGMSMLDFCLREFPALFDYGFTAQMETRLDKIAEGNEPWKQVCRDTWNSYKDTLATLKSRKKEGPTGSSSARVREFSDGYKAVLGKKGPILLLEHPSEVEGEKGKTTFFGWPEGVAFQAITEAEAMEFIQNKQSGAGATGAAWGTWSGQPILEKKGPYGPYVECGGVRVNIAQGDTPESIQQKLASKKESALHTLGEFEFRKGPFGVYMFKKATVGKKPTFVGLPEGLDPKTLTQEAADRLYKNGIEQKRSGAGFRGRGRGGARGRGRGRGRGS